MLVYATMASDPSSYILGWFAAFIGTIGFGSFAVPIKGDAANSVDIDPLVMQSYKSLMCFLTSWLVVLLGQEVTFTWWGLVSGLFWVPGGAFNIFAIRNAGLAISQGIVASSIVMVSFIWGNLIFREPVKNQIIAYGAVWLIMAGLYGMSYYSTAESLAAESAGITMTSHGEEKNEEEEGLMRKKSDDSFENDSSAPPSESLEITTQQHPMRRGRSILICGRTYSRRNLGLFSALMCGTWGGSCLVPMHYSSGDTNGLGYVISFSIGAIAVTILLWILRFGYQLFKLKSPKEAYEVLPSFHFRVMWLPGATAGSLWSLGNVGSIVAVEHLGQGVGYSASQGALLISGIWGIFYFKEVSKPVIIGKWFLSAFVTITGILLLGYESSPAEPGRR
mmetsp:Transcript_32989/g.79803  ORF Transcript_32989/g.79803 Transcript_32989/m.79803 type:complete len:392 (-) Transcript_32989:219-1394(-)